jgi:flagellar biosynthetic protein FlhB
MAEDMGGDRTEAPTAKRKQKAVDDGDILRSREFATALVMLAGVAWLIYGGPALMAALKEVLRTSFTFGRAEVEDFSPTRPLGEAMWRLAPSLGILFAVGVGASILSQAGLGSLGFNGKLLAPKFSRLDPMQGIKRVFGMNGWIELLKSLLKVALLGTIGWYMLSAASHRMLGLAASDLNIALGELGGEMTGILFAMAGGLVLIALLDVPVQLVRLINRLKMTKQEVKDEHKEAEGSPEAKNHIRAKQRAMSSRSLRKAVAEAHVILTNPTHFSVALRYERGGDQVPVVVAKGRGATALAIREIAAEVGTPRLEYPLLARALYFTSREGQEIRDDLYMAVATVLAFVFGLNDAQRRGPPQVDVPKTARFDENGLAQA